MRTAIFIVGAPGTGKTTLTRALIAWLRLVSDHSEILRGGWLPARVFQKGQRRLHVLGVFDHVAKSYVEGTDKLSMAVQPHFEKQLQMIDVDYVIEGDRLANTKTIAALRDHGYTVHVLHMIVEADERECRSGPGAVIKRPVSSAAA